MLKRVTIAHLGLDELSALALDELTRRVDQHEDEAPKFWVRVGIRLQDEQVRRMRYERGERPIGVAAPFTLPRLTPAELDAAFKSLLAVWRKLRPAALDTDAIICCPARAFSA
jgi:hypothetical protein